MTVPHQDIPTEDLRALYRQMLLIRRFEEKAGQLYGMGLIGGFCHLCIGQEAVVVGVEAAARDGDRRITSYRNHGLMLACGLEPARIMAELTGRADGYGGGKAGSMHMVSPEHGFYGGHALVGAQVPIAAGLAFADQYTGSDAVTFCYFGDAAANRGQVHETLLMASQMRLPVVFIIENNQHGLVPASVRRPAPPPLADRGLPFGLKGQSVDGMDVLAVRAAAQAATARVRSGKGPALLEMRTFRYRGHSMSDPAKYRTREEVARMREERDAIAHLRSLLLAGHTTEDDLRSLDRAVKDTVSAAADSARAGEPPQPEALLTSVYPTS